MTQIQMVDTAWGESLPIPVLPYICGADGRAGLVIHLKVRGCPDPDAHIDELIQKRQGFGIPFCGMAKVTP